MELKDKLKDRYATKVCKEFGELQWNEAKIGAGNDYIQRTVTNAVLGGKLYYTHPTENIKTKRHTYKTKIMPHKGNNLDSRRLTQRKEYRMQQEHTTKQSKSIKNAQETVGLA